jgi:hypothetical protein
VSRVAAWTVGLAAVAALVTTAFLASAGRRGAAFEGAAASTPAERVRVEVLNAGGVSGLARDATARLRDTGFDVVHFGNARVFDRESSEVIDRVGRPDLAQAVANALGIRNVRTEPDPNLFVDVTVLLGRTWSGAAGAVASSERPPRAPWDPRGWLGR